MFLCTYYACRGENLSYFSSNFMIKWVQLTLWNIKKSIRKIFALTNTDHSTKRPIRIADYSIRYSSFDYWHTPKINCNTVCYLLNVKKSLCHLCGRKERNWEQEYQCWGLLFSLYSSVYCAILYSAVNRTMSHQLAPVKYQLLFIPATACGVFRSQQKIFRQNTD